VSRKQEHLLALALIMAVAGTAVIGSRFQTFRLFFEWPTGGTWANTIDWLLCLGLAWFSGWWMRDLLGRGLVGWLHRHHAPRLHEVLDEHYRNRLEGDLAAIRAALLALHRRLDGE